MYLFVPEKNELLFVLLRCEQNTLLMSKKPKLIINLFY